MAMFHITDTLYEEKETLPTRSASFPKVNSNLQHKILILVY